MLEEETIVLGTDGGGTIQEFENGEWIPRLRNRVTSLGKELFGKGADYTFPLDLLVNELEGTCVDIIIQYVCVRVISHIISPFT